MADTTTIVSIPRQLTPLIGRERELNAIQALLCTSSRLVTITGIGGIGKTRLAHQVALELEPEFAAGAMFVSLADIREADQIAFEVTRTLGISITSGGVESIIETLGHEPRLLVLDNLEQIPAAGTVIANMLEHLPNLAMLCTSQIPLNVPGEHLFPLHAMPTPAPDQPATGPAVELFQTRARAVNPHLQYDGAQADIVAEICRMVDGIPLAIELAAGRTSILTPTELRDRLGNRLEVLAGGSATMPNRLRTMRNAIAWSYDLLDDDQKRVFRYISVYSGGISLAAITDTLSTLEITDSTLDVVDFLVTRGMLQRIDSRTSSPRYQMLPTLREFGAEQLAADGDDFGARLSHGNYVVNLAEDAEPHLQSAGQAAWLDRLDDDLDNIAVASTWAASHRPDITLRVISSIWRFLQFRSQVPRFLTLGQQALEADLPSDVLAKGWSGVGLLMGHLQQDSNDAYETAIRHARIAGDAGMEVRSISGLGYNALVRGDLEKAQSYYEQSLEMNEALSSDHGLSSTHTNLGIIHAYRGEFDHALERLHTATRYAHAAGDRAAIARLHNNMAAISNNMGRHKAGREYAEKALAIAREMQNDQETFNSLWVLANSHQALDAWEESERLIAEAIPLAHKAGRLTEALDLKTSLIDIHLHRKNIPAANQEVVDILTAAAADPERHSSAIVACAGSVISYAPGHVKRKSLAELIGGVQAWRERQVSVKIQQPDAALREHLESIKDDPDPEMQNALAAGSQWNLAQLQSSALSMALEIKSSLPTVPVAEAEAPRANVNLTARELDVLAKMAKGHTNAEIADELFISERTITTHASNIFGKLEVKNRSAAVAYARKAGLLQA